jgi:hypothetical protein
VIDDNSYWIYVMRKERPFADRDEPETDLLADEVEELDLEGEDDAQAENAADKRDHNGPKKSESSGTPQAALREAATAPLPPPI